MEYKTLKEAYKIFEKRGFDNFNHYRDVHTYYLHSGHKSNRESDVKIVQSFLNYFNLIEEEDYYLNHLEMYVLDDMRIELVMNQQFFEDEYGDTVIKGNIMNEIQTLYDFTHLIGDNILFDIIIKCGECVGLYRACDKHLKIQNILHARGNFEREEYLCDDVLFDKYLDSLSQETKKELVEFGLL